MRALAVASSLLLALLVPASGLAYGPPLELKPFFSVFGGLNRTGLGKAKTKHHKGHRTNHAKKAAKHRMHRAEMEDLAIAKAQDEANKEAILFLVNSTVRERVIKRAIEKGEKKRQEEEKKQQQKAAEEEKKQQKKAAARAVCDKIAFIRPQKTGGKTLGEVIMPKMTAANNQTQENTYHMEYRWAMATAPNCIVASLRNPTERFLSEYSMLKDDSGAVEQDEWDFHANDMAWLSEMKSRKLADSFKEYMSFPGNPAFNRQARYLLGFERVQCSERCCGICSHGEPGYPAYAYDFVGKHDELLALAKQRLLSLRAFTLQECFTKSVRKLAEQVGWNPDDAEKLAGQEPKSNATRLREFRRNFGVKGQLSLKKTDKMMREKWRSTVTQSMKEEIKKKNLVDAELYKFAKQQFYEKYGIECTPKGED